MFVIRPLAVFICTYKSNLKFNEKLFISWVGPRGIVAAGIASLFGSKLLKQGVEGAEYITPLVFMIVLGTVLLNATTARLFAKIVGVFLKNSDGILIIGASKASRLIASYLQNLGKRVVLIDANTSFIEQSTNQGLESYAVNIYDDDLTDNIELNDDYINLSEAVRDFPNLYEIPIHSDKDYRETLEKLHLQLESIPLFVKTTDNNIYVLSEFETKKLPTKDTVLVYVGQEI